MGPKKNKTKTPTWFKDSASEHDKILFQRALVNYMAFTLPPNAPKPKQEVKTFVAVLPSVAALIPRWNRVTAENFSTHQW